MAWDIGAGQQGSWDIGAAQVPVSDSSVTYAMLWRLAVVFILIGF